MHFYKHYLLRIFSYRNTGSSLCIDQSKPLLAERPRPLLTVFHGSTSLYKSNFFAAAIAIFSYFNKNTFYILKQIYNLLNNTRTKLYKTSSLQTTFYNLLLHVEATQKGKNLQSCT